MNYYNAYALKFIIFAAALSAIILVFSLKNFGVLSDFYINTYTNKVSNESINIIIDAGHGGEDGGANANGVLEKELNLAISTALDSYFNLTNYNSHMTREDDRLLYDAGQENRKKYYDLENRVKYANQFDNAIFLSIHQNKFEIPKYKGLQVYYSPNNAKSLQLAETIQSNARTFLDTQNKREVKKADHKIRVLDKIQMPAVLIECGFLSNYEESQLLSDANYQNKLAFMVFISTIKFLEENGVNESQ